MGETALALTFRSMDNDAEPRSMDELEKMFIAWAQKRDDIRAAIIVGSRARTDHPGDEWADLDVGFLTIDLRTYTESADWLEEIAPVWTWYADPGGITRHVLFAGGFDAGLAPAPVASVKTATRFLPLLRRFPLLFRLVPGGSRIRQDVDAVSDYYRRGVRVILDKDGLAAKFLALFPASALHRSPPAEAEFASAVREFWFTSVWTAKHLRRGELWWAKSRGCDGRMKSLVLKMMEWQAWASHGPDYDTWSDGRFLEEWGDARALDAVRWSFAHYDANDIWRALLVTMDTFRQLAVDTAERLGFEYPTNADERVTEWVTACRAGATNKP